MPAGTDPLVQHLKHPMLRSARLKTSAERRGSRVTRCVSTRPRRHLPCPHSMTLTKFRSSILRVLSAGSLRLKGRPQGRDGHTGPDVVGSEAHRQPHSISSGPRPPNGGAGTQHQPWRPILRSHWAPVKIRDRSQATSPSLRRPEMLPQWSCAWPCWQWSNRTSAQTERSHYAGKSGGWVSSNERSAAGNHRAANWFARWSRRTGRSWRTLEPTGSVVRAALEPPRLRLLNAPSPAVDLTAIHRPKADPPVKLARHPIVRSRSPGAVASDGLPKPKVSTT